MYKLLLVDDEKIIRMGIEKMLLQHVPKVELIGSCANAFDALDEMQDEMPDILISDIRMPGMNGLELIGRALKMYPSMQVIVLSGFDDFDYARNAMKLGVKEYLLKPCDRNELNGALDRACETVDEMRKRVSGKLDERTERIMALTERLAALGDGEKGGQALREALKSLLESEGNEDIFVEAMVRLIIAARRGDDWWRIEAIRGLYTGERKDIIEAAAQILEQLYSRKGKKHIFVERMCDYILENYQEPALSLQYIAEQVVFMNADYIGKEFANDMGMKFSQFLHQVRIGQAKKLIASEEPLSLYEIAEQVGYGDRQYFSQIFKKVCGMTPKEFRDSLHLSKDMV